MLNTIRVLGHHFNIRTTIFGDLMMNDLLANWLVKYRFALALLSILTLGFFAYGMTTLKMNTDFRIFFNDDYPSLVAYDNMETIYSRSDNILFLVGAADGEVFTKENLTIIESLTEEAWKLSFSTRVDSITNYQHTYAENDDLIVEQLVEDASLLTNTDLARIKEISLNDAVLLKRLIAPRSHVTVVHVSLELPEPQGKAVIKVMTEARALSKRFMDANPGLVIHLAGQTPINNAFNEVATEDFSGLWPIMLLLIIFFSIILLRSVSATVSLMILIVSGIIMTMGTTGWIGWAINSVNATAPTIILTLAVADCVHLLATYLQQIREGDNKVEAMSESLRINIQPIFLTSFTTAIGFLSMNFSDSPPFRELGNIAAIGVMGTLIYTLTLLPAVAILLTNTKQARKSKKTINLAPFSRWIIKNQNVIFIGTIVVSLGFISMVPLNSLNDDTIGYFHKNTEIRQASDYAQDNISGVQRIGYSFDTGTSGGINEPAFLQKMEAFTEWVRVQPEVDHIYTYSDIIKRLNQNMHGDDPSYYRLPQSRELASQYLLLYEMSLPFGLDLTNQVSADKSSLRVTVTLKNARANKLLGFEDRVQVWLQENAPELASPGASIAIMFANIGQDNIKGMLKGTAIALIIISLTLIIAFRSVKYGLLSLIPNAFPAGIAFGIWGIFVGNINLGAAVVFSITLGIVVDDSVHYLSKYIRSRKENKSSPEEAVHYAFEHVGMALVITTIILTVGFFTLYFSNFDVNSTMGLLVSGTIVIALVFDMLFLPTLLLKEEKWERRHLAKNEVNATKSPSLQDSSNQEPEGDSLAS